MLASLASRLPRLPPRLARHEPSLYVLWAGLCTLASARSFYGSMLGQTGGEWSAPLDDVFIHFDYARATALGHPFEWVIGNGYSSGNTSILYPFVLALGYAAGFTGQRLMTWAAVVAAMCVLAVLIAGRALFVDSGRGVASKAAAGLVTPDGWSRASSYLLPPMLLGIGALDWTLWSGMEVAFFLATWACALGAYFALVHAPGSSLARRAWALGAWGVIMILTRPEATTTIAAFGISAAWVRRPRLSRTRALALLARVGGPGAAALGVQSIVNRLLTGEWTANGAIVKLALYNPFLTAEDKLADYTFNLKYEVLRNTEYHFTDAPGFGVLLPALAIAAVAVPHTRRLALLLWAQIAGWLLIVALNGQVRWQNERYTMPAVAWLLVAAALGAGALLRRRGRPNVLVAVLLGALAVQAVGVATRVPGTNPEIRVAWDTAILIGVGLAAALAIWPVRVACVVLALFVARDHQVTKMRGQRWFFGRASRNIRDQHVVAGRWLAELEPHRILVGDAGALIYASNRLGLDIIGLGGYGRLPFARAGVQGLPATLELMERIPSADRPDVLAIYPSWWGVLPTWFASDVIARFPVEGNVICGGYEDVVYKADWRLLGTGTLLRNLPEGERVKDEVDVADLLSEGDHAYLFPSPLGGWTDMKILPDPLAPELDMFDGGRTIGASRAERFRVRGLTPGRAAHLVVRSAPTAAARVSVRVAGAKVAELSFVPTDGWVETAAPIPAANVSSEMDIELVSEGPGDFVDYHAWATQ